MNLVPMKKVTLPKPLPQSYVLIRNFVLDRRDRIHVVERHKGNGLRYYVNQEDVNRVAKEELGVK
jgi:hypothetical protein